ncbi:ComEC/Rec2 family competence protein [Psychrobacter sp. SWN149]|uniref:ComEC/Rec2 family competence protein n=1 Tax=Psychrobacter sp. SWN149 TaxID=2792057 RepID=UPI0018CDAB8E|nr:ComEC/Rec2 family competence protein [Psychrobacter sp. SWN149]MBH0006929.1 ComEC/Rec2 family competence protein [Psychrobacter sp. SWN149]
MYWLIGSLIIIIMMGVLAVADDALVPVDLFLLDMVSVSNLSLLLIVLAVILMVSAQFNTPPVVIQKVVNDHATYLPYNNNLSLRIIKYLLFAILTIALVIGSALQALVSHQQAESAKIIHPIRVQALVRVEGLSDSVYDTSTDSGYRQVAVVTNLSPLIAELDAQDLAESTSNHLENKQNSLSDNTLSNNGNIEYRVLLNAYPKPLSSSDSLAALNDLQPGDQLFMSLALTPLASSEQVLNNPSGFDSYRWLRGRHIDGAANILAVSTSTISYEALPKQVVTSQSYLQRFRTYIDRGRWQLRQHFYKNWLRHSTAEQQAKAVTLSLLTGDRSLISRDTKDLYQLAGISHLLAISGTHVLFLAIVMAGTVVLLFNRFCPIGYRYIPCWQVRWWVMIGAAFIYALFTGFDVPAARTAWMLLAIGLVRLTMLPTSTMKVLLALAILMAWRDPYVLWQAGYWLSFIAVALLLKYDDTSYQYNTSASAPHRVHSGTNSNNVRTKNTVLNHAWQVVRRIAKLQFWLFITLLPTTLLLFGKASLWGLVINLFAIGLFGWVIVPLNLLAGLCYLLSPTIADGIWMLVIAIVGALHDFITWLTSLPLLSGVWLYTPVNIAIVLMVFLFMLPWLLPRGFISRWLALTPLTLLIMTVYANQQSLTTVPTLYVLPTGDSYISASLLQYPIAHNAARSGINKRQKSTHWLFLADHRPKNARTMTSSLTADALSAILEQQLGSLSVNNLEGIIVQSNSIGLTDTINTNDQRVDFDIGTSELLPMTMAQLSQKLPVSQYWQAGRSDRWTQLQQAYQVTSQADRASNISAQRCDQGKIWQLPSGCLTIQVLTGWSTINDASVWDCSIAIDTDLPIQVLRYNAADPLQSLDMTAQMDMEHTHLADTKLKSSKVIEHQETPAVSRLILNTDTHQRVWQMWELLCSDEGFNEIIASSQTKWLGHSASHITADIMRHQNIDNVITLDDKPLDAASSLNKHDDVVNTNTNTNTNIKSP